MVSPVLLINYYNYLGEEGGDVTLKSFYEAAEKGIFIILYYFYILLMVIIFLKYVFLSECANTVYNELRPFKCLDLTYISVLLEQGFGLPLETSVSVSCLILTILICNIK